MNDMVGGQTRRQRQRRQRHLAVALRPGAAGVVVACAGSFGHQGRAVVAVAACAALAAWSQFGSLASAAALTAPLAGSSGAVAYALRRSSSMPRLASWEPGRFAKTVSFFRGNPWKLLMPPFLQGEDERVSSRQPSTAEAEPVVIDWGRTDSLRVGDAWGALDDVVMGGVSLSALDVVGGRDGDRRLAFSGRTSRENNGGFCSFRSRVFSPPFDFGGFDGLAFSARCRDGLRYKLQLRDNDGWDSLGWAASFDTAPGAEEVEVRIPFASLVPNFRSKTQTGADPLKKGSIYSMQFVLSAFEFDGGTNPLFKEGDFRLELGPIRAYRAA
mmetsp:Transcript_115340/g.373043  ORF Transcript_115340/g.373043 Transcript_115340/m.373043 type:complete len:328 (+) Transcript_115340:88-1071(+)